MSAGTYKPSVVETKVAHRFVFKASLALEGRRVDAAGDAVLQRGSGFHARRCRQCEQPRLIEDVGAAVPSNSFPGGCDLRERFVH